MATMPSWGCVLHLVLVLLYCWYHQIHNGLGVAGYTPPVFWGVYITTFVFWIGIGHAGTLISAVLFLFRSKWRTGVYRASEGHDDFCGHDSLVYSPHCTWVGYGTHMAVPVPQPARALAKLQVATDVGRLRGFDLLHCIDHFLLCWSTAGYRSCA